MNIKSNRWVFTSPIHPNLKLTNVDFLVYQEETGEKTNYKHFQGYVEFKKEYSLQYVKSLFKSKQIHLEIALESRAINILYCTKLKTRTGGCLMYNSKTDTGLINQDEDIGEVFEDSNKHPPEPLQHPV